MDAREALEQFIRYVTRDTIYLGTYAAEVQGQHDDDSLELLPDDQRVRGTGLSRVPIRHGLPGVRVRVIVGARVLLAFEAGDPRRPYAALWEPSAIQEILFDGGKAPVARVGDPVAIYWPASLMVTGAIAAPAGAFTGTITIATQSPGIIQSGAKRVKA